MVDIISSQKKKEFKQFSQTNMLINISKLKTIKQIIVKISKTISVSALVNKFLKSSAKRAYNMNKYIVNKKIFNFMIF